MSFRDDARRTLSQPQLLKALAYYITVSYYSLIGLCVNYEFGITFRNGEKGESYHTFCGGLSLEFAF